jgi:uncharacterized RDD family membrane protein YckC
LGPYFLGYFVLAYCGKWVFRRFAFAKIQQEAVLSSKKAVREQKLAKEAARDAAVDLQTTYASFWRRLGAFLLDVTILGILGAILGGILGVMSFLPKALEQLSAYVVGWLYVAIMLSSRCQATLGKLALGIFVTDQKGGRLHFGRATARLFAMYLSYIILGIGFFIQPFTRKHQALHDLIAGTVVLVRPEKKRVPWWIVVLCVLIGLMYATVFILAVWSASKQ